MINENLLKLTMLYIKTFPEKHDQGAWVEPCNSTMCFAGHAAILSGATFKNKIYENEEEWLVDETTGKHKAWDSLSKRVYISDFARKKLGLTAGEADYLFHQRRTPAELEKAVEMLSSGYTVDYHGVFTKREGATV